MSDIPVVKTKNKTLGVALLVSIPADLEALSSKFGSDVVYNAAVRQTFYGPWNNAFRKAICTRLEEVTGIKRRQKVKGGVAQVTTKKDGSETPILESEQDYIKFLLGENHISEADYAVEAQKVADITEFKMAKPGEDEEPDEEYFVAARQVLASIEVGKIGSDGNPVTEDSVTAKFVSLNPGLDFEALGGFTELGIARALEINANRIKRESANSVL